MVRSIGADRVIDYTQEDFTKSGPRHDRRYDIILDCVGNHSLSAIRGVLTPKGIYVGVGGPSDPWMIGSLAHAITALVLTWFTNHRLVMVLAKANKDDLTIMRELMESRKVTPVLDRRYSLSEVPEAIRYLEEGHARGKVVISLG